MAATSAKKRFAPHVIIEARAGSGKTTTLTSGLRKMLDLPVDIVPSPQQKAVWDTIALSKGAKNIAITAFNKKIALELQDKVPSGVKACTINSLGYAVVRANLGNRIGVDSWRTSNIICELIGKPYKDVRAECFPLLTATENLVNLCKQTLTQPTPDELDELVAYYEIELGTEEVSYRSEVYDLIPRVMERSKDVRKDGKVDYADQIWLPIVFNMPVVPYDLLLVDEAQDLNRCQHELVKKLGKRLIFCGDPKQAIYGFAGADAKSMERLQAELTTTPNGVELLPLTVTRRCGKAIVAEANRIVPDFYAHESNPTGEISTAKFEGQTGTYHEQVREGDMLLCRVNAPLVNECFRFLREGKRANIQGRDVGQGLISLIKKQKAESVPDLITKLSVWLDEETAKEQAKTRPSEAKIITMTDKVDCIYIFSEGCNDIKCLITKIEDIFTDDPKKPGIKLSSIHKSKGLENHRVFLLEPKKATVPHPMAKSAWQIEQEWNLRYVAITRAIYKLTYVK